VIKPLSLKKLEKDGVSILFKNASAKRLVEKMLYEKLNGKVKPPGFMDTKTLYEVSCVLPKEIDAHQLCRDIGAAKFWCVLTRL
jgi:hypothetical protein